MWCMVPCLEMDSIRCCFKEYPSSGAWLDSYLCDGQLPVRWTVTCSTDSYLCDGQLPVRQTVTCAMDSYLCERQLPV